MTRLQGVPPYAVFPNPDNREIQYSAMLESECQLPNQIYNLCHKRKLVEAVLSIFLHQYFQCACPAFSFKHVIFQAIFSSQHLIFFEPDILPEHPLCSELSTAFFGGTSSYPPIQSANRPITDKSHIIMPTPYAPFQELFLIKVR